MANIDDIDKLLEQSYVAVCRYFNAILITFRRRRLQALQETIAKAPQRLTLAHPRGVQKETEIATGTEKEKEVATEKDVVVMKRTVGVVRLTEKGGGVETEGTTFSFALFPSRSNGFFSGSRSPDRKRSRNDDDRRERRRDDRDRRDRGDRDYDGDRRREDRDRRPRDGRDRDYDRDRRGSRRERERDDRRLDDKRKAGTFPNFYSLANLCLVEALISEDVGDRDARTVFVSNLPLKADERDIREFFSKAGKVRDVRLITDRFSRKSKGYVSFFTSLGSLFW